jgi:hypothetical protein
MGILAQERMLLVLMFIGMPSAWAAEGPYRLSAVDFFALKERQPVWVEPGGYTPPSVVTALLNDPNEQTARAYLQWMQERLDRITRAQKVLDEVQVKLSTKARP